MSVHDEGIERIIAWLRTQEAEEVKPAITALRELQTLRRNSDKYDTLLSEVKAAREAMVMYQDTFTKDCERDKGVRLGTHACIAIVDNFMP